MRAILLVSAAFFALGISHRHENDGTMGKGKGPINARVSTSECQDLRKKDFLDDTGTKVVTDIKEPRADGHPRQKMFPANEMDHRTKKTKTHLNSEENVPKLEIYPETKRDQSQLASIMKRKQQQKSDMTQVRSSRQRRTVQTPETKLVCQEEFSCRNKCRNPRKVMYEVQLSCFCDEECEFFGDCCADYEEYCGTNVQNVTNGTAQNTSAEENLVNQYNKGLWGCYKGKEVEGTEGVWMIGSCPSSWPKDDVLYRCRNLSQTNKITIDNYRYLPVYTSNGRVYHNRFCAQCNGVSPNDLRSFTLSIECAFTPPRHLSVESTISFLFSYCEKISLTAKSPRWSLRKGDPRRYCLPVFIIWYDDCPSNRTLDKCRKGKPGIVNCGSLFCRNIGCAKCTSYGHYYRSCGPNITATVYHHWQSPWTFFSVIFDFNNDRHWKGPMQIKTPCPSGKVYDHHLDICTNTIPALPNLENFYEYQVVLWLEQFISSKLAADVYQQAIAQELAVPVKQVRNIEVQRNISFTIQIRRKDGLQPRLQNILNFTSPFNITMNRDTYTVIKATSRTLSCVHRQKYARSEYTVLLDGSSAVYIKKTGEVLEYTQYYINTTEASRSANDSQAIFVCRQHQTSNCSGVYILMKEGEFRVLINKSIFVNASKQVYDWSEYIWRDKRVLVCENFSQTYHRSKVVSHDDPLLTTITIVFMSLSIIGLVFVLVTYSLFSELRTPPGINLMNLSVSILLAQLLWLLGSGQTDTTVACTVIAVILHYLFLVSFMWTSIIAFDTCRALSSENQAFSYPEVQVFRRMTVGWLGTLLYESICVTLGFTDTIHIGHKDMVTCWMTDKWAILYFFAVPVFLCLLFNTVFCVMTFRAIKVTTAQTRPATDPNTKKNFNIYIRIASLMGFTWIFGFAAPFGWQFLWYAFVILNGLQGVYIAVAFALNDEARGLYRRLIKSPSPATEASDISVPRTKTTDTESSRIKIDTKL